MNPRGLKTLLENFDQPFVIPNLLDWSILDWDLEQWNAALKGSVLKFRKGKIAHTKDPQWESHTEIVEGTLDDFLKFCNDSHYWYYFDYKYLIEWFLDQKQIRNDINWTKFGFEKFANDSTIWIGTKGAHTPCHIDVYGFNLIAQIFGRKRWLLFPPNEDLLKTRVPYEESSIYSKINFYSPDENNLRGFDSCRELILEPGQVLFVPNGWWHYVENLETAISINTWLPLTSDNEKRMQEAIVQMLMKILASQVTEGDRNILLNPNENIEESVYGCVRNIEAMKNIYRNAIKVPQRIELASELYNKFKDNLVQPAVLSREEFTRLMVKQSRRFAKDKEESSTNSSSDLIDVINAITDCDVIELIKNKMLGK
ncbi:PREDICTED: HSPB1-associated protein 1 [Nicrophorus vespilloides]|uniref:HSPB1-associated protein 1 n=1 Tax=Nicrophorus vespilloides TaxID=110193 RepID=A0ABM1MPT0_NICVS|nr:PREDICTED: HSPB1-associated protein 1 [Nicrophorus vespilloides]